MGNTVWAIKWLFRYLNEQSLAGLKVDALLARVGPRRARALPCFTVEETGRILAAIETTSPHGKRDYAMVRLALSTGLRCGWMRSTGTATRSAWCSTRHRRR